jgi:hypothetical protein
LSCVILNLRLIVWLSAFLSSPTRLPLVPLPKPFSAVVITGDSWHGAVINVRSGFLSLQAKPAVIFVPVHWSHSSYSWIARRTKPRGAEQQNTRN